MREIKFRAFIKNLDDIDKRIPSTPDKVNDHFIYGNLVRSAYNTDDSDLILSDQDDNELLNWQQSIPKDTAEEYTGLNDKNGKEIYEGDLVRLTDDLEDPIYKVIFDEAKFEIIGGGVCYDLGEEFMDCEVIGNVHENPELLKA